ncbi:hydrogenase maturation protease [Fontivita pretiosa]|jgi:hydrogenase maturation protease|uniref:hydrogenase maturation protease n=1 Tax=Fontivita pretiosa TaxID=2989684 RepID=UPI003D170670
MSSTGIEVPTLVIGCGNPLRSDDAAGWVVAERVSRMIGPDRAAVLVVHQLTPELAAPVSRAGQVIFIDAAADLPPGELCLSTIEPAASHGASMTHVLDASRLLALAGRVFGRCPPAHLLAIGGTDFGIGQRLSAVVQQACEVAARRVCELVFGDGGGGLGVKVEANA